MLEYSHVKAQTAHTDTPAKRMYALYFERMLGLIDGALDLAYADDDTPSVVLIRSALECYVDLYNLSRDGEDYLLILRAMTLESRSALFHYKTPPFYDHFVKELGASGAANKGKEIAGQMTEMVKMASDRYPILRYHPRNLTILNRFRIAGMEDRYHTMYTWLSMQAHNAPEQILVDEGMRVTGAFMDEAQDGVDQATVIHFAIELLVDTVKCTEAILGKDEEYTRRFLSLLEQVAGKEAARD